MSENLELLVKLASFGTAGVSVLAIFGIGYNIQKLPNDAPEWKPRLMIKYMSMCIVIAIICAASGGVNAYFNRGKIVAAENRLDQAEQVYDSQLTQVKAERDAIQVNLNTLRAALTPTQRLDPQVSSALDSTEVRLKRMDLKPMKEVLRSP